MHVTALDSLRGLAAMYVVIHHAIQLSGLEIDHRGSSSFVQGIIHFFSYGRFSVDLFIVLSGFCLMLPVIRNRGNLRGGVKDFFLRRASRILPTYYLSVAFCLALIYTVIGQKTGQPWDLALPVNFKDVVTHLLLIHDLFPDSVFKINGSFWSISVEWRIYFLFPVLLILWNYLGGIKTTSIAVVSSLLLYFVLLKTPGFNSSPIGPSIHYIGLFSMGMLAATIVFNHGKFPPFFKNPNVWLSTVIASLLIAFSGYREIYLAGRFWLLYDVAFGLACMSFLVFVLAFEETWLRKFLNLRCLAFLGFFSYSLYLIHAPILQIIIQYLITPLSLNPDMKMMFLLVVASPVAIVISYGFFLIAEKPFMSQRAKQVLQIKS